MNRIPLVFIAFTCILQAAGEAARADTVVQIPVTSILNTRSVTTLTDGKLVTWQVGIDGDGNSDGYLTSAASLFKGDKNIKALPDSGRVPADAKHPEVVLNYSNADGIGNQTRYVRGVGDFTFPVPPAKYSKLFVFLTSSEGPSSLTFKLTYSDSSESLNVTLPDYFDVLPGTGMVFNLLTNMAKWTKANVPAENTGHNLDGVELHPAAGKTLTEVKVSKTTAKTYLVFWGATGIAITPVTGVLPGKNAAGSGKGALGNPGVMKIGWDGRIFGFAAPEAEGGVFTASGRKILMTP